MGIRLEVAVVGISYRGIAGSTVVEVFGRTSEGLSVVLLVHGMRPWLEVSRPGPPQPINTVEIERLRGVKHVVDVQGPVDKLTEQGVKPVWRLYVEQPFLVPRVRDALDGRWLTYSSDIVFGQRLLLDRNLGLHIGVKGELIAATSEAAAHIGTKPPLDEEEALLLAGASGRYPSDLVVRSDLTDLYHVEPFIAPLTTLSFDLETSIQHGTVLCAAAVLRTSDGDTEATFTGNEREIIQGLIDFVRKCDPDIITGYNINNFDIPVLERRIEAMPAKERLRLALGRVPFDDDRGKPNRSSSRWWRCTGRVIMDAWWEARMALRPERESLKHVSQLLFPDQMEKRKMDVDASRMDEEWEERPDVVLEYCLQDAKLPLDILDAIAAQRRRESLGAVAKIPLETAVNGTTSQWVDSLLVRLAERSQVVVPRTKGQRSRESIEGGYVHDVKMGLSTWIAVLDFKSMCPSIMIEHNICSTTRTEEEYSGVHIAPTGAMFVDKKERLGLIPQILTDLMASRDFHKNEMQLAEKNENEHMYAFHDRLQESVKILMNSFYGVLASSFYRFTHPDLGASITAWARRKVRSIIKQLTDEGSEVIYSDTDSIFVAVPMDERPSPAKPSQDADQNEWESALTCMIAYGESLAERYSSGGEMLEFEKGLAAFFSHGAKKRYVGRVVHPRFETIVRGYEPRRTDGFPIQSRTLEVMFEHLLDDELEVAIELALETIRRLKFGEVNSRDLVISRSCKGRVKKEDGSIDFTKDYVNPNSLAHVQTAMKRIERGLSFTPGMKVSWIVTDAKTSPMTVEPYLVDETGGEPPGPDYSFYTRRLATALGRITEAFGWTSEDLIAGTRQTTLFSFQE